MSSVSTPSPSCLLLGGDTHRTNANNPWHVWLLKYRAAIVAHGEEGRVTQGPGSCVKSPYCMSRSVLQGCFLGGLRGSTETGRCCWDPPPLPPPPCQVWTGNRKPPVDHALRAAAPLRTGNVEQEVAVNPRRCGSNAGENAAACLTHKGVPFFNVSFGNKTGKSTF